MVSDLNFDERIAMSDPKPRRGGFTLVELLVVIAITGVLIAVLLPSLNEARKSAQNVVCKSRERQIGIAFANYAVNNKQYYPYACPYRSSDWTNTSADERAWSFKISEYLGSYRLTDTPKQLICPANPWPVLAVGTSRVSTPATYGMGPAYPWTGAAQPSDPITIRMVKDSAIKMPSRVLLLGETPLGQNTEYGRSFSEGMKMDQRNFRTDNVSYSSQAPIGMWYGTEISAPPGGTNPTARVNHNVGWNSLMSDGSVVYHTKARLQTLAMQATGGTDDSDGLMFWLNRTE